MIIINVCIGSACHIKGSYSVIKTFQRLILENNLEDKVEIKGAFCCGSCIKPVSIKIDNEPVTFVTPETVEQFFKDNILRRI